MRLGKIIKLILAIVLCQLAGVIGSVFTTPNISTWYAGLIKPSFNPPNWVFGPVWTLLFLLMGIALYLVITPVAEKRIKQQALAWFGGQLVLNIGWSILFFGLKSPGWALVEIIILWLAILITIIKFYKVSQTASWLLWPYLAWVSFATALNFTIWLIN